MEFSNTAAMVLVVCGCASIVLLPIAKQFGWLGRTPRTQRLALSVWIASAAFIVSLPASAQEGLPAGVAGWIAPVMLGVVLAYVFEILRKHPWFRADSAR